MTTKTKQTKEINLSNLTNAQLQQVVEGNFNDVALKVLSVATEAHFFGMPETLVDQRVDYDLGRYVQRAWENVYGNVDSMSAGKGPLDVVPANEVHNRTTKGWMDECEARLQKALDGTPDDSVPVADRAAASEQAQAEREAMPDSSIVEDLQEQVEMAKFRYFIGRSFLDAWLTVYSDFTGQQFVNRAWTSRNRPTGATNTSGAGSLMERMRANVGSQSSEATTANA